ncbi:ABC transporter permease [bacterium]|nr:ABC transporter permease [bacterium]
MIKFILKGLFRDKSRSLFPILTVFSGVFLTVFLYSYLNGFMTEMIRTTAHFDTGHVKIMTRAYAEEKSQIPNDLALTDVDSILASLNSRYPTMYWQPRIRFGGLLDIPDERGETKEQTPVYGMAVDLTGKNSVEKRILELENKIVSGKIITRPDQIIVSTLLAEKLKVSPGDTVTLISSTMNGSMTMWNFVISGTVQFGISGLDKSLVIVDLSGIQQALDMENCAGEIIGLFKNDLYIKDQSSSIAENFNEKYKDSEDEFAPVMVTLYNQNELASYLDMAAMFSGIIAFIFIGAMSIVLWNAGLLGGLRRYGEFGIRLAMGETKPKIYKSLILESLLIGIFGSILGTMAGLAISYFLEYHGLNMSSMFRNATLTVNDVIRADVNATSYYIGFIPGICATILGSAISGINIFKRNTAQLFKKLEA